MPEPVSGEKQKVLHIVTGCAGSGKTALLLEKIKDAAKKGERSIFLVPEQYSFEAELLVRRELGPGPALNVEVLSFTRLCDSVGRLHGGLAGTPVTRAGKYLFMSLAAEQLRDSLKVYRKSALNPSFLETLVSACAEFKTSGVTPEKLGEVAAGCEKGPLRDKLYDLCALYGAYGALIERGYQDPDDDLVKTAAILRENGYMSGVNIFVDGFATFMAAEFLLLKALIAQAGEFTAAFTADGLFDREGGVGPFSIPAQAAGRIIRYAKEAGVTVASPVNLTKPQRAQNGETRRIAGHFMRSGAEPLQEEPRHVFYHEAADPWREVEYVALKISEIVRKKGFAYRDIAVVARDTGPYLRALERSFARRSIPYFVDDRRDVSSTVLAGGLMSALEAVRSSLDTDAVLAWAKSPMGGFPEEEVARLENYCYCWSVRGALWEGEWRNNPRGLAGPLTGEDEAALLALNSTRKAVVSPLIALREALAQCDGEGFAAGVYAFLEGIGAAKRLSEFAGDLPAGEREVFLDESAQLWDALMEILDIFGAVLGATCLPASRFHELFRLCLSSLELGFIPQTLDQVLVGGADRIRPKEVKAVFLIGAVEGEFPASFSSGGVFTDEERRRIIELGAEIGAPGLQRAVLEKYFCAFAVSLPSHELYVSCHKNKMNGAECFPSELITSLRNLFPRLMPHTPDPLESATCEAAAFDLLAARYREDTPQTAALLAFFKDERLEALNRMERAAVKAPRKIEDPAVAKALFGASMVLSPTRVERYHRCAFSYFAQDGLSLRPRRRAEFTPLESGSVIHHVLQVMVQRHGSALFELDSRAMKKEIDSVIDGYLTGHVASKEAMPTRLGYLYTRLSDMLSRLLRHLGEELAQSEFEPVAFELPISGGGEAEPLELVAADGVTVRVEGFVDRVDVMEREGRRYVRVVDYKSGSREFRLEDVIYGLNLQMLLYLFTLSEQEKGRFWGAVPAGVLYFPARDGYVSLGRDSPESEALAAHRKALRMDGLLLNDEECLRGMERELKGVFIPVKLNKDGSPDSRSALAGKAEMGRLSRRIKDTVAEMALRLSRGDIPAMPTSYAGRSPCEYCDYAPLCGFEEGDPARAVRRMDTAEALKMLAGEDEALEKLD
ncbi:MAG: PD-(D/E)XK nuclease family protein [Oscillospiraceae bacterium]|jgi:ATP-dependent helicase/nuclease subunit B|nr:PD-(D/E)XK nuclease family protein [Oscillospiraceae bacterium]